MASKINLPSTNIDPKDITLLYHGSCASALLHVHVQKHGITDLFTFFMQVEKPPCQIHFVFHVECWEFRLPYV